MTTAVIHHVACACGAAVDVPAPHPSFVAVRAAEFIAAHAGSSGCWITDHVLYHQWRSCLSKTTYTSRPLAKSAAKKIARHQHHHLYPYQCAYGDHWHLSSTRVAA